MLKSCKVLLIGILKNEHWVEPIRIYTEDQVTLSNTCNFDAIIQILCISYRDSEIFKRTLEEKKEKIEMC